MKKSGMTVDVPKYKCLNNETHVIIIKPRNIQEFLINRETSKPGVDN